jgi:hypothetical protein
LLPCLVKETGLHQVGNGGEVNAGEPVTEGPEVAAEPAVLGSSGLRGGQEGCPQGRNAEHGHPRCPYLCVPPFYTSFPSYLSVGTKEGSGQLSNKAQTTFTPCQSRFTQVKTKTQRSCVKSQAWKPTSDLVLSSHTWPGQKAMLPVLHLLCPQS